MTNFCLIAQGIYFINQDMLDGDISIDTLVEELLLDDSLDIYINRGLPLRSRIGTFDC
jgi:elongation factor P hydroxylase